MHNPSWGTEVQVLVICVVIAGFVGLLTGLGVWAVCFALLGYGLWMIYRFHTLEQWMSRGSTPSDAPDSSGVLGNVVQLVSRDHRRQQVEFDALKISLDQFDRMAVGFPDATVVVDEHLQIQWCNDAAGLLLGIYRHRDIGQRVDNLIRIPEFLAFVHQSELDGEIEIPSPVNGDQTIAIRRSLSGNGEFSMYSGRDVTQRVRLRDMRKAFVADVSHELRTPLTVIQGNMELLQDDPVFQNETKEYLDNIDRQSRRMHNIVEDLLTLSRIESSTLSGDEGVVIPVPSLLARLVEEADQSDTGRHTLTLDANEQLEILGVEKEIFSVCQNLLQNAINYATPDTAISVQWALESSGATLTVKDSGPGIAEHHLARLTERFYRVDRARSRSTGGTGLGLAIVKHIVQRHNATLGIASEIPLGSTFTVHFPADRTLLGGEKVTIDDNPTGTFSGGTARPLADPSPSLGTDTLH